MLMSKYKLVLSNTIKRKLTHRASLLTLNKLENQDVRKLHNLGKEKLDFAKTSIQPFLNMEEINVLKSFYQTKSEMTCTYSFVTQEDVAIDIVKNVLRSTEQKKFIMEVNPGLGLITLNLINSGVSQILLFDHSDLWKVSLAQISAKYPNRIVRKTGNIHRNADFILLSSLDFALQYGFPATFVGVTTSLYFFRSLVINFIKYDLWQSKFHTFLVVSTLVYKNIKNSEKPRHLKLFVHCLFNIIFDVEEIARYPRAAFLPFSKNNSEEMVLIKVSVNPNFAEKIDGNELHDYMVFLKIIGTKKSNFVIAVLEKWLPDCGPYLISKGISVTTQIQDLTREEIFLLFNFVKEFNGYDDFKDCTSSLFPRAMNI